MNTRADGEAFETVVPVRWADLDRLGHVNHARYHEYLEEARCEFLRQRVGSDPTRFVLARIELDHIAELGPSDKTVVVSIRLARVGESSLQLSHTLASTTGEIAARGETVLVAWDDKSRGKRSLSAVERTRLDTAQSIATG